MSKEIQFQKDSVLYVLKERHEDQGGVIAIPADVTAPYKNDDGVYHTAVQFFFDSELPADNGTPLVVNAETASTAPVESEDYVQFDSNHVYGEVMSKIDFVTLKGERSRTYSFVGQSDLVVGGVTKFRQEEDGSHRLETSGGNKLFVRNWNTLIIDADDWSV